MMNVLLRPFAREERNPDPLLVGLLSYNSNDGFGRAAGEQLNFAAPSEDEAEYPPGAYLKKGKVSRQDPMSHRIIEKRRRDRMNNCLADLSRLIPPEYLKKGRGRVEKTEIIEMAIRHLKYLQERANAADRQAGDDFRAGFQEAVAEAVRFLVEAQGYAPDGLCAQLASHLQRHIEVVTKGSPVGHEKAARSHPGSSSETASSSGSSGSSHGYGAKPAGLQPPPPPFHDTYDAPPDPPYAMECDRVAAGALAAGEGAEADEAQPLDARRKRKELPDDYLHSYKFKNCIERRFSRSQDNEPADMSRTHVGKLYSHKRRRAGKAPPAPSGSSTSASASSTSASASSTSASASNSGSTEDARDTSPQDTSSDSPHHHHYEKPPPPTQFVPVFALNALGKYYVPLSVDAACLARHLGAYDVLDARAAQLAAPLHPVTIHVNFQPCLNYHNNYVKREPNDREWRA